MAAKQMRESVPKLVSGAGYMMLYETDYYTFEWSNQKKYLRKTVWKREAGYQGLLKKEELYIWVSDKMERERIKSISEFWNPVSRGKKIMNVTLYEQVKKGWSRQATGYLKILEAVPDERGNTKNLVRFYKRVGE